MQGSNGKSKWFKSRFDILILLKLILGIIITTIVGSYPYLPSNVSAQTDMTSFPGTVIIERTMDIIRPGSELMRLENDQIMDWEPASGHYRIWRYDPAITGNDSPFLDPPMVEGVWQTSQLGNNLIYLGNYNFFVWNPTSGRYRIQPYRTDGSGKMDLLSGQASVQGTLADGGPGNHFIHLGNQKMLEWEPESGQYRIWRYDPAITGAVDRFPGELIVAGQWETIRTGHELIYLGYRRLLDWEPETGRYRIWRYDPMITGQANPLVGPPVAEGVWTTIGSGHRLMDLPQNRLMEWNPETGHYRIWQYDLRAIGAATLEEIAEALEDASGVTVISHGRQFSDDDGDSLMGLALDIHLNGGGWLIDYDVDEEGNPFIDCPENCETPIAGQKGTKEVVFLFDWAAGSNERSSGWGEAAGDALFNALILIGQLDPLGLDNPPYHFIGHSFGTAVTSELIERLAYFGLVVDHVTYLDPHDFVQDGLLDFDGSQEMFTLGKPQDNDEQTTWDYGVTVWNNVVFADVYYQTRGESGNLDAIIPNGRPISGAYNKALFNELPDPADYPFFSFDNDHNYVLNCFYRATVTGALPGAVCPDPIVTPVYTQTGYAFSRLEQPENRPAPNFYGANQSHIYSHPDLVDPTTGEANAAGLMALGLDEEKIIHGQWSPDWVPFLIVNGDFQHYSNQEWSGLNPLGCVDILPPFENTCPQPGWSHHDGGGRGHFKQENDQAYLILDGKPLFLPVSPNDVHTHNRFYIPPNTTQLHFDLQREDGSDPIDRLEILLGSQVLASYDLEDSHTDDNFMPRIIDIPDDFLGQVSTLTFRIVKAGSEVESEVWIDNVRLFAPQDIQVLVGTTDIPDGSGSVDFGLTALGTPRDKSFTVKNIGNVDLTLTEPIMVPAGFSIVNSFAKTTLAPGQVTSFTIRLEGAAHGSFSGFVEFANNDADENPFNFDIRGRVNANIYLPLIVKLV